MSRVYKLAPLFVFIGTVGLLVNEFIMNWGRTTTLVFAAISLLGFTFMSLGLLQRNDVQVDENS